MKAQSKDKQKPELPRNSGLDERVVPRVQIFEILVGQVRGLENDLTAPVRELISHARVEQPKIRRRAQWRAYGFVRIVLMTPRCPAECKETIREKVPCSELDPVRHSGLAEQRIVGVTVEILDGTRRSLS
jgi:hypothetical protein